MGCHLHDLIDDYEKEKVLAHVQFDEPKGRIDELIKEGGAGHGTN